MALTYIIRERKVQSFNNAGQPVERLMRNTMREAASLARATAPTRSTTLKRSIKVTRPPRRTSIYGLQGRVTAGAPYAAFVHDGTTGPIRPKTSKFLVVPSKKGNEPGSQLMSGVFLTKSVRGQSANPFLRRGISAAMKRSRKLFYGRRF